MPCNHLLVFSCDANVMFPTSEHLSDIPGLNMLGIIMIGNKHGSKVSHLHRPLLALHEQFEKPGFHALRDCPLQLHSYLGIQLIDSAVSCLKTCQ
jgi:hypothetical protein